MDNQTIETNQIYNAFKEAGLESEARKLSTTKNQEVVPAIGRYIVLMESALEERADGDGLLDIVDTDDSGLESEDSKRHRELANSKYNEAKEGILDYFRSSDYQIAITNLMSKDKLRKNEDFYQFENTVKKLMEVENDN
ncbi:MAG: hypothetical protein PHH54_04810 [Candidatus Nanoarchaeia archaeon]|nr:hypothetical protein [Candidatus Nanoarchaeia archaeon]MDD5741278.1 hypothetical protein [Candidatus Nanoarchaeia archaeon]